jgi:2-alkyl-3-oxoalkanoate reductase
MRVLVTGGGGFLGRYIVRRLLERGDRVTILGRGEHPDLTARGVATVRADLASSEQVIAACRGQDVVFHVAALAGIWGPRQAFFRTNVIGTRNVLAGCRRHGVPKLIYTSTPSVVFSGEALRNVDESQPYGSNWLCHYAETKAQAEAEVLAANGPGLRTVALRPHLIWGIGDNHLIPRVVARARAGRLRIVGDGQNKVDIAHVENAAEAHLLAERALEESGRADGKAYFISQGEPVVLWEWINDLLRRLQVPAIEKRVSLPAAYRLGAALEGVYSLLRLRREPPMTRFLAVELAKDHYFNITAARRDLGYQPRKGTEEGVAELVDHLRKNSAARDSASV